MFVLNRLIFNTNFKHTNLSVKKLLLLQSIEKEIYVRIYRSHKSYNHIGSLFLFNKLLTSYFNYLSWVKKYDVLVYKSFNSDKKISINNTTGNNYLQKLINKKKIKNNKKSTLENKNILIHNSRKYISNKYEIPVKFLELVVRVNNKQNIKIKKNKNRINYFSNIRKRMLFLKKTKFFKNKHTFQEILGQVETNKEKKIKSKKYKLLDIVHTMKSNLIFKKFTSFTKIHYYNRRYSYYSEMYENKTFDYVMEKLTYMKKYLVNFYFYGLSYKLNNYLNAKDLNAFIYESFDFNKQIFLNTQKTTSLNNFKFDTITEETITETAKFFISKILNSLSLGSKNLYKKKVQNVDISKSFFKKCKNNKAYLYTLNKKNSINKGYTKKIIRPRPLKKVKSIKYFGNKQLNKSKNIKTIKQQLRIRKSLNLLKKTHAFFKILLNKLKKNNCFSVVAYYKHQYEYSPEDYLTKKSKFLTIFKSRYKSRFKSITKNNWHKRYIKTWVYRNRKRLKFDGEKYRHFKHSWRLKKPEKVRRTRKEWLDRNFKLKVVKTATWLLNTIGWIKVVNRSKALSSIHRSKKFVYNGLEYGIVFSDINTYYNLMSNNMSINIYNNYTPFYKSLIYIINNKTAVVNNYNYLKSKGNFFKKYNKPEFFRSINLKLSLNNANSMYNNYDFEGITAYLNNYLIRHTVIKFSNNKYNFLPSKPIDTRLKNYKYLYKINYNKPFTTRITREVSFYDANRNFISMYSYIRKKLRKIEETETREFNIRYQFKQIYLYFFFKWYNKNIFNHSLSLLYNSFFAIKKERMSLKQKIVSYFFDNRISTIIYKKTPINIFLTLRGFNGKVQYSLSSGQIRMYGKRKIAPFTIRKLTRIFTVKIRKHMSAFKISFFRILIKGSMLNIWQFLSVLNFRSKRKSRDRSTVYSCYLFFRNYIGYLKTKIALDRKNVKLDLHYYINLINYLYILLEYITEKPENMKFCRFHIMYLQVKKNYSFIK